MIKHLFHTTALRYNRRCSKFLKFGTSETSQKPIFNIGIFLSVFFFFFNFTSCQNEKLTPQSADNFPTDTITKVFNTLPSSIKESSGLLFFQNSIWTHNDSGNDPAVYQLSSQNSDWNQPLNFKKIKLEGATNIDWEELAQDSIHIYIGDFGNNGGQRQDLIIYKVAKTELSKDTISNFEKIEFRFEDQTRFDYDFYEHDFDCEAMIIEGDSIYLFSKNHQNYRCRLYHLPKTAGSHIAKISDSFDSKGTITAAGIDKKNDILTLAGYKFNRDDNSFNPFIWILWDYEGTGFFKGKRQRVNFSFDRKIEGLCFFENDQFLLSSEGELGELFLFDPQNWME